MLIAHIINATRTIGKSQGYLGLPIRDDFVTEGDEKQHFMTSAWQPTPEELEALNQGASVLVTVLGRKGPIGNPDNTFLSPPNHPPISVNVGGVPKFDGG